MGSSVRALLRVVSQLCMGPIMRALDDHQIVVGTLGV
jgi:hypothetical protein